MNRPSVFELFVATLLLVGVGAIPVQGAELAEPSPLHSFVVLEGTIGASLEVRLFLTIDPGWEEADSSRVSGWYEYKSIKKPITLWGDLDEEGTMALEEGVLVRDGEEEDEITGRFNGAWEEDDEGTAKTYAGTWSSPDGTKSHPFILTETYAPGIARVDRYHFAVKYERKRGVEEILRSHSLTLPQVRGDSSAIARINAYLRSAAVSYGGDELVDTEEIDDAAWSDPETAPTLEAVELAVDVAKVEEDEMEFGLFHTAEFNDDFEIVYNSGDLLCLRFYQDSYTGGAHGNQWDSHVTFDLATGKVVELDDLLKEGWEEPLTRLAEAAIRRDYGLRDDQPLNEGPLFEDAFELNSNWFLSPEGIGFSYVPYEIGPYAAGFIQPVVPREELTDLLKSDSLLERAMSR